MSVLQIVESAAMSNAVFGTGYRIDDFGLLCILNNNK